MHDLVLVANALATIAPTAQLAVDVFGGPPDRGLDLTARLLGLRDEDSLLPWIEGRTSDVEELARLDYEPTAGPAWREEWHRHLAESFVVLEAQIGPQWPDRLASIAQDDTTHCRQSASALPEIQEARHAA